MSPTQDAANLLKKQAAAIANTHILILPEENPEAQTYLPRNPNRLLQLYIITDIIAIAAGFFYAWALATVVNDLIFGRIVMGQMASYGSIKLLQSAALAAGVITWFQHTGHYRLRMSFWLEVKKIAAAMGFTMMADGFLQFAGKQDFSRLWLMSSWVIAGICIIALRSIVRSYFIKRGLFQIHTLLIGSGETAAHTRSALASEPGFGYEIAAQINNLPEAFLQAGASWKKLCAIHHANHIIIALDGHDLANADRPLAQLARENISFSVSPPLRHMPVFGMAAQYFFSHDTMLLTRTSGLELPLHCFMKRAFDIVLSGTVLLALSPIMLVTAILVKLDGGPAFFGHNRIGRNGTSFPCLKFRSMAVNGDQILKKHIAENPEDLKEWQETRKLRNDPRVTKLGGFLRRSSLDELPQLINVLRGDMSLVGPRPIVTAEVANYDGDIAHYYRVRPGITGLWQVSGRSDVSYRQRVQMDSWYVRNWSLWHDIAIICKTVPALLNRSGAY